MSLQTKSRIAATTSSGALRLGQCPVAAIIVFVYFGIVRSHFVLGVIAIAVLGALIIWTAPNRWGAGIALHYLSRVYFPDPADPIPASTNPDGRA